MIKHSKCLYNGDIIGIEYIISAKDGKQINIPGRTEWLKEQGKKDKLFCTCGCGANLIVVAGDKGLRRQHFRIKKPGNRICTVVEESEESILSKVALKCWMCDKLNDEDIVANLPANMVTTTDRRYEYTFYSRSNSIGLVYWKYRLNILDERLAILNEKNSNHVIFVLSGLNDGNTGQYPLFINKLQERQGYGLFLYLPSEEEKLDLALYENSELKASIFCEAFDGEWHEICIAQGKLTEYDICNENGSIVYQGELLSKRASNAERQFFDEQERLKKIKQIEEDERKRREDLRLAEIERQRQENLERQKKIEEAERLRKEKELQKQNAKKQQVQAECEQLGVYEVSLLTRQEAEYVRKSLLARKCTWWLCTKGVKADEVDVVYDRGTLNTGDISFMRGVRPVVRLKENIEEPYCADETIELAGYTFTLLNSNTALCDDFIGNVVFRKDSSAPDANEYSKSEVKKFIDDWCEKNYIVCCSE